MLVSIRRAVAGGVDPGSDTQRSALAGVTALDGDYAGQNTAEGEDALFMLGPTPTGFNNTATGFNALLSNTDGFQNTANGVNALLSNTIGANNIALGFGAGANLTRGSNNIDIGHPGRNAGESRIIRIGKKGTHENTFIAGINGVTVAGGVGVIIDSNGQLGTVTSSERFKDEIKPMDKASEAILALKPVTFHYKKELDPVGIPQFGLVAEQVEKVNSALVARDETGKVYTVRYEAVNAMLLNEFLKEHGKVEEQNRKLLEQEAMITALKSADAKRGNTIAQQQKQIEAITSGLQEVNDQLAASKTTAALVVNNQ